MEQSAASVILCNDEESTIKLSSFLESNCPHVFAIHEGIDAMAANRWEPIGANIINYKQFYVDTGLNCAVKKIYRFLNSSNSLDHFTHK